MIKYSDGGVSNNNPLEPSAIDRLNSRINAISSNVASITPYTESKTAYIGDTEVRFSKVKDGMITANCITESGLSVPITLEVTEDIKVLFDELNEVATVSISIQ